MILAATARRSTQPKEDTMTGTKNTSKPATKSAKSHPPAPAPVHPAPAASPEPGLATVPPEATLALEPLPTRVTGALALVNQATATLAVTATALTAAQVKASTKFRKGGETQIPLLANLSASYGVEVPSRPTADMEAHLAEATALAPLLLVVSRLLAVLESATFQARSEAWATATTLYQMLRKASVRQPALKAELAPLKEFFAYRHPLVTETAPATQVQLAKEATRQRNVAKKQKRLLDAAAAAAGAANPAATTNGANGTNGAPPALPAAPATGTGNHS
jgi:hypothetical protein